MNKSETLLDIFKSLPEEERNKVYAAMELTALENDIHILFDSLDFVHMNSQDFIKLKRKLGDLKLLVQGIKSKEVRSDE